jgi:tetratricopeptide (TPR) repeat protein
MAQEEPGEQTPSQGESPSQTPSSPTPERPRPAGITSELRRFLGGPARFRRERRARAEQTEEVEAPASVEKTVPELRPERASEMARTPRAEAESSEREPRDRPTGPPGAALPDTKLRHAAEMQNVVLIVGAGFVLLIAFYVGKKFDYWKALLASRNRSKLAGLVTEKYPGLSADELVERALVAERLGNWHEAAERFVAAKWKNPMYRGILFRAGKLCYDHGDFDNADKLLEHAIISGEHVDMANYLRGLIAVGHSNLPAAEGFFEAAANAEPFTPGYYYYWAEALRKDHHPKEAIRRYEQAAVRTAGEQDATVCRFKERMARVETGETSQLSAEIENKRSAGPLSVDWSLTAAALQIRAGNISEAIPLIDQARAADEQRLFSLFASCTADMLFTQACRNHPEIAQACRVGTAAPAAP